MLKSRMPPQIERLAIVTVAIVVVYFTARAFLVPASFGKYGWYRADALKDYAALPVTYAGAAACLECHDDVAALKAKGGHKLLACEGCHGPLYAHTGDPTIAAVPKIADQRFCVRCHEANPARPEKFPQVNVEEHAGRKNCTECHKAHQPHLEPKPAEKETPKPGA